ncbi:MAG: hypothetical protein GXO48_05200 [Chlorobi bacterium]|nr:hypothetical protein [Chlorobiota bacterium]
MKTPKVIKLIAALTPIEIREIRKALKKEKDPELLQTFDFLIKNIRKGRIKGSEAFIIKKNLSNVQFPYVTIHKLQNFILNQLAWVLLTSHKTHKLYLRLLHSVILFNKGIIDDALELEKELQTQLLSLGHPSLITSLAFYKSTRENTAHNLNEIIHLWDTATKNQYLILKSGVLFSRAFRGVLGIFAKRDLSNIPPKAKKTIRELLGLPKPKGYLPAYVLLIRKHDMLFYILGRFDLSYKLVVPLDKLSRILFSVYQPEARAAILTRLIRHAVIQANQENIMTTFAEVESLLNNPSLVTAWKTNLTTKLPYKYQILGQIDEANKVIKRILKSYPIKSDVAILKNLISINDLLELIFLRINNHIISQKHRSAISRDLNLVSSIITTLDTKDYDSLFFDLLFLICKSVHHKKPYWHRQLRKATESNDTLSEFADLIVKWSGEENKKDKQDYYLRWLKKIIWTIPGVGHILSILNIPGWMLRETMSGGEAERIGRALTSKFLGL